MSNYKKWEHKMRYVSAVVSGPPPVFKTLYVDQYGNKFYASSLKELRKQISGRCTKMYIDHNGKSYHVGYVIGSHWLNAYQAVVKED